MRTSQLTRTSLAVVVSAIAAPAFATDWLQFGFDQAHSGFNTAEHGYSTNLGNQLVYSQVLPNAVDSAPIFLSKVVTLAGTRDLLFINALNGTLMAIDASDGSLVWSKQPSTSLMGAIQAGGVAGSPAVDPSLLFVYSFGLDGKVHKYKVGDGTETLTGGWPEVSTLKPDVEKGSASLSFASPAVGAAYLYSVTSGYYGDSGDYQGHVTAIDLSTGAQNVYNSQCSNLFSHFVENGTAGVDDCNFSARGGPLGSGIWGRPGAIYDTATNKIYIATGNGYFDANATTGDHFAWGDTILALNANGTGAGVGLPVDSYTPTSYVSMFNDDVDLGSTSPAILPSSSLKYPHLAVQSGKDGCVRLIDLDNMSGAAGAGHVGGELNAATSCAGDNIPSQVVTQPAVWVNPADKTTWFFINSNIGLYGYHLGFDGSGNPSLTQPLATPLSALHAGTSPVIANDELYYASRCSSSPCAVYAVDASSGSVIWQSASPTGIHWQSPIIVNGRLYLVDDNGSSAKSTLWVYALDGIFKNGFQ